MDYNIWYGDISLENVRKLIKHCDKRIDRWEARTRKEMARLIKQEVKKAMRERRK